MILQVRAIELSGFLTKELNMSIKKTIEFKGTTVINAHITAVMPAIAMGNRIKVSTKWIDRPLPGHSKWRA